MSHLRPLLLVALGVVCFLVSVTEGQESYWDEDSTDDSDDYSTTEDDSYSYNTYDWGGDDYSATDPDDVMVMNLTPANNNRGNDNPPSNQAPACDWRPMRNSIKGFPSFTWNLMKQSSYRRNRNNSGRNNSRGGNSWSNSGWSNGRGTGRWTNVMSGGGGRGNSRSPTNNGRGGSSMGGRLTGGFGFGNSWGRSVGMGSSGRGGGVGAGGGSYWNTGRYGNMGMMSGGGRGGGGMGGMGGRNNGKFGNLQMAGSQSIGRNTPCGKNSCKFNQISMGRTAQWGALCNKQ